MLKQRPPGKMEDLPNFLMSFALGIVTIFWGIKNTRAREAGFDIHLESRRAGTRRVGDDGHKGSILLCCMDKVIAASSNKAFRISRNHGTHIGKDSRVIVGCLFQAESTSQPASHYRDFHISPHP